MQEERKDLVKEWRDMDGWMASRNQKPESNLVGVKRQLARPGGDALRGDRAWLRPFNPKNLNRGREPYFWFLIGEAYHFNKC